MCVLCVQEIAKLQGDLQRPSTSAERRRELQEEVQDYENWIKSLKSHISSDDADIKQHQAAMAALQGEPFCVAIVTVEFYLKMVAMPTRCLQASQTTTPIAMPTRLPWLPTGSCS